MLFLTIEWVGSKKDCQQYITYRLRLSLRVVITYSKSMYQSGKVANPAHGELNRENKYFPVRVRA